MFPAHVCTLNMTVQILSYPVPGSLCPVLDHDRPEFVSLVVGIKE